MQPARDGHAGGVQRLVLYRRAKTAGELFAFIEKTAETLLGKV